jgi:hypothetical protein
MTLPHLDQGLRRISSKSPMRLWILRLRGRRSPFSFQVLGEGALACYCSETPGPPAMPGAVLEVGRRWQVRLDKSIGEGGFGAVFRAKDTKGSPPCDSAAKRVSLTNPVDKEAFHTELSVLHVVHDIESVIGLQGSADTGEHGWMFLEMATGGELFDRLIDSGSLSERKCHARTP